MGRAEASRAGRGGALKVVFFAGPDRAASTACSSTSWSAAGTACTSPSAAAPTTWTSSPADVRDLAALHARPRSDAASHERVVASLLAGAGGGRRRAVPHPRYADAPVLRRRVTAKTIEELEARRRRFDPLTRTLGLLAVRRLAAATDARAVRRA